jgi:hypothetical protein
MTTFLNLIAAEPDIARVPIMIDSSKWERDRGRPEVRAGQGDRQLDQPEGGRGQVPRQARQVPALRRRGGGDGLRRAGPGRHRRAQGRDLRARLHAADRAARLPPEDIIFDPNIFAVATGIEEHNNYASTSSRRRGRSSSAALRAHLRRRLQRLVRFRGNEPVRRGDALGVPLPRHRRRAWTWASSTPASCRSTTRSTRSCASGRGRDPQPPADAPSGWSSSRRALQGRRGGREGVDLAWREGRSPSG